MVQAEAEAPVEDVLYAYTPNVYDQQWGPNERAMIQMIDPAPEGTEGSQWSDIGLLKVRMIRWRVDTATQAPPLTPAEKRRVIEALDAHPRYTRVTPADIPANLTMADVQATDAEIARLREENAILKQLRDLTGAEGSDLPDADAEDEDDEYAPPDPNIEWEKAPEAIVGTPYPEPLPSERPATAVRYAKGGRRLALMPCPVPNCERSLPGRWVPKGSMRNHARMMVKHDTYPDQTAAHQAWLDANPAQA